MTRPDEHSASAKRSSASAKSSDQLFELVYEELRRIAHRHRARFKGNQTLRTVDLVHEVYLKFDQGPDARFESETHFRCVASKAMRHLLVDHARRRRAEIHGGNLHRVDLEVGILGEEGIVHIDEDTADQLVALDRELKRLAEVNKRQAEVVDCRFFGGLSIAETAEALSLGTATVKRDWAKAQEWLYARLHETGQDSRREGSE